MFSLPWHSSSVIAPCDNVVSALGQDVHSVPPYASLYDPTSQAEHGRVPVSE